MGIGGGEGTGFKFEQNCVFIKKMKIHVGGSCLYYVEFKYFITLNSSLMRILIGLEICYLTIK